MCKHKATKKKVKRIKQKFSLSALLGKLFPLIILAGVITIDVIFLTNFEFDFNNVALMIILGIVNIPAFIYFVRYIICLCLYFAHDYDIRHTRIVSQARGGAPGRGKSSSMYNDVIIMAEMAWRKVCYEYFLIQLHLFKPKENRSAEWDRKAITECYEFFRTHKEYIPCLYSKDTLTDKYGSKSQKLTLDHLQGKRKLLYRAVLAYDEIGKDLPAMTKFIDDVNKNVNLKKVADFMRYLRHYGNFKIIYTEQDVKNMYIGNRRVTDENLLFIEQKTVLRPIIFDYIQYFHEWLIASIQQSSKPISKVLSIFIGRYFKAFDNFVSYIGFRKFKYKTIGNVDNSLVAERKGTFILMPHLNCSYDDRNNKFLYEAYNNDYNSDNEQLNDEPIYNDSQTSIGFVKDPE